MKRQIMTSPGEIKFVETEIPEIAPNELLIRVKRIGICGSDVHVYHGLHPLTNYPVTQGHEVSGIISKIGSKVSLFSVDDQVVIRPQVTCNTCYYCTKGEYHICNDLKVMGFQTLGMASEYIAISQDLVLKVPSTISLNEAALVEPLAVALSAVEKLDQVEKKDIIVLGAGPIGNLIAQVAKAKGANSVLMTDINPYRLDLAKKLGIDYTININAESLENAVNRIYPDKRADSILECVGSQQTVNDAISNARKGSQIILVGVFGKKPVVNFSTVQDHELRLIGMLMYKHHHFEEAIELLKQQKVSVKPLITHHFGFEQYKDSYEKLLVESNKVMKILIDVDR